MAWFRVTSDRLTYRGRLSQEPYSKWTTTAEGSAAIDARKERDRLWLFKRSRARRRIWRDLDAIGRSESLRLAVQSEADRFTALLGECSHAPGLPRRFVALHRLVVLPRTLVAGRIRTAVRKRLSTIEPLTALDAHVTNFLCEQLVVELDTALAARRPSVAHPSLTYDGWGCVGRDTDYQWVDPMFSGPGWSGHFLMFEFPRQGLTRQTRKELERQIQELRSSLTSVTREQRHEIVRMAVDALPRMTA